MKRILITGASGFIGNYLVQEALNRDYEVWASVRASSSRENLSDPRIHLIELDFNHPKQIVKQVESFSKQYGCWNYVIHNAGITKALNSSRFLEVNGLATQGFINVLQNTGCVPERFVLMSSLSSFGPGDEKEFAPIHNNMPQQPNTEYGKSKLYAENTLRNSARFPYTILRPTGVYGPGDKDYLLEIKSIRSGFDFTVGMNQQHLTFIYVKDLARVALDVLATDKTQNKEYFVADGDKYTDTQFAEIIKEILHKKLLLSVRIPIWAVSAVCAGSEAIGQLIEKPMTLNSDKLQILKQRNWLCDTKPLQEDIQFKAVYPLRKGLEETIEWYKEHKWL